MKPACTPSWVITSALLLAYGSPLGLAQSQKPAPKKSAAPRANELTLAGLRPGRDTLSRAKTTIRGFGNGQSSQENELVWFDHCRKLSLTIDANASQRIQEIHASTWSGSTADCHVTAQSPWKTGLGLRVGDSTAKILQLYGPPDSRSPGSKGGQPLELWYFAFDWAGPDVPQVMEILCTAEKDGKAGQVLEITLAGPSL